ncbi:MAG: hypothetical protein KGM24_06835, partial [Elusimicrobia bacterium]|nr:hypothetical protein [Elusimicrobiota bacterium]
RALLERGTPEERGAAARRRAALHGEIAALQLRAAWLQLTGAAPLTAPAVRRNAALWSLVGAYNSAAAARADAGWLEGRERAEALFDGGAVVVSRRWTVARPQDDAAAPPRRRLAVPVATAVGYDGAGKAVRAQLHALDSAKREYLAVLAREAALARWTRVLSGPRPTKRDRAAARADLLEARDWAARGFVAAKQSAAQELDAALSALARGDDALAARHAGWAQDELAQRRAELERIAAGLRARLARLARRA